MNLKGSDCDILFLSYSEPCAEANFQSLISRFPRSKRLHGVTGMGRAYRLTAEIIDTDYYFIVDADNLVSPHFDFNQIQVPEQKNIIKIWSSENAVNGLTYGYGGVKLCCRRGMRSLKDDKLDVLASGENTLVFDRQVASTTCFNTSPFDAWKAGFRECCMLKAGSGIEMPREKADAKIQAWTSRGSDQPNGEWAITGAKDGIDYALQNNANFFALKKIDDPLWLKKEFLTRYPQSK